MPVAALFNEYVYVTKNGYTITEMLRGLWGDMCIVEGPDKLPVYVQFKTFSGANVRIDLACRQYLIDLLEHAPEVYHERVRVRGVALGGPTAGCLDIVWG